MSDKEQSLRSGNGGEVPRPLVDELTGALRFIMAFYEPGQTYLDTNAWKVAEAGGRSALAKGEVFLSAQAAAAEQEASQVRVKALEWRDDRFGAEARTSIGRYFVEDMGDKAPLEKRYCLQFESTLGWFPTIDEAKAAAQADYEQRILSALEIKP